MSTLSIFIEHTCSYTLMANAQTNALELHYPVIQFFNKSE